jgi:hypothetical protein
MGQGGFAEQGGGGREGQGGGGPEEQGGGGRQGQGLGKAVSQSKASADTAGDQDSDVNNAPPPVDRATSIQMVVPYLLNIKMLSTGDELLVFKAAIAAPKRARDVEPIRLSDLVKKQRE